MSDEAVADAIRGLLGAAGRRQPLFVFAITMENHGPLHLETTTHEDVARLCSSPPPAGCADLVVYLRHLANADRMIGSLREFLEAAPRPAALCFYGDHVPIMARVYAALGSPDGATDYLIWNKGEAPPASAPATLGVECLAQRPIALFPLLALLMDQRRRDPDGASTPVS